MNGERPRPPRQIVQCPKTLREQQELKQALDKRFPDTRFRHTPDAHGVGLKWRGKPTERHVSQYLFEQGLIGVVSKLDPTPDAGLGMTL